MSQVTLKGLKTSSLILDLQNCPLSYLLIMNLNPPSAILNYCINPVFLNYPSCTVTCIIQKISTLAPFGQNGSPIASLPPINASAIVSNSASSSTSFNKHHDLDLLSNGLIIISLAGS
jgi:hypothetical protein